MGNRNKFTNMSYILYFHIYLRVNFLKRPDLCLLVNIFNSLLTKPYLFCLWGLETRILAPEVLRAKNHLCSFLALSLDLNWLFKSYNIYPLTGDTTHHMRVQPPTKHYFILNPTPENDLWPQSIFCCNCRCFFSMSNRL